MIRYRPLARALVLLSALATAACAPMGPGGGGAVDPDAPVEIALLVPLGSSDPQREGLGQGLANAAELARQDVRDVDLRITVHPTGGTPEQARAAASAAVEAGADVVLGPLFSDSTIAAAPVAQGAGLQVLSFSNNPDVAGGNVFLLGTSFRTAAERIAGYTIAQGLTQVAIVHPEGAEGELARQAVADAVARAGGTVVGSAGYPLSVQGITENMPAIARQVRGSGANVVVLTDGPTGGLAFVAETLRGLGVRQQAVQFAGLQRWDTSPQTLSQPALDRGWFPAPDPATAGAFAGRYEAAYGAAPHPLAGLGYDGIAAIAALVAEARAEGSSDPFSTTRLTKPSGFAGALGIFRFNGDGTGDRALAVFAVTDDTALPIDPARRSFGADGS
ncbi:penicillin-binding protein activator [Oceanibium sediminis]|uniref:penicillin-binding protein activator n=1 Tax=Oceanibium sediminis TaxID=2026339 RepID=UPI000DD334F3|nr:penicillin-binding protein activator [Oceanibium sediminis]